MTHSPFVHLHLHTQYSLLDGAIQHDRLFGHCKALGMPAVAMTDHGNLFGAVEFYEKASKAGIKPILGCEVYVAAGSRFEKEKREKDASGFDAISHLLLLAMNETGYRNLVHLVSKGYLEGFYYKPRIDLELLRARSEGLIATSGCLSSMVSRAILAGDVKSAWSLVEEFSRIFDGRYYLELQRHGIAAQEQVNAELVRMATDLRLPLVATNDAHYLGCDDHEPHEALLCIGTATTLSDPKRFRFDGKGFFVKSGAEMLEVFHDRPDAVARTIEIAERCNFDLPMGTYHLPEFQVPAGTTREAVLEREAWLGLRRRLGLAPDEPLRAAHAEYEKRMRHELSVIASMGFAGYFLIVGDFISHARSHGVPVGPGRGSSAGSLVAYGLGITGVDPIEYDIIFERFLNPERISMPDIDVDFCIRGRDRVIDYVARKYDEPGDDGRRVAQIITFGKLQARAAIRDVGRVLGMPYGDVDRIAKLVPETLGITLDDALVQSPELRARGEADGQVAKLLQVARRLEGLTRHASTHAAGVVIGSRPLIEMVPLYRDPKSGAVVTQYDWKCIEKVGLIKFDFLGLKTLTVIHDAERLIRAGGRPDFSAETVPLDDAATYELLARGDTDGVFQVESPGMTDLVVKLKPRAFKELIPLVALYRPGPLGSGMVDDFVSRRHGLTKVEYPVPELEDLLAETLGVIVYQDQVLQIANRLAGFSLGEADLLRRAMGKKNPLEMEKQREHFVSGCRERRIPEKKAEEIFRLMAEFAGYGFPKAHATAYALITYQTAYLKANHPREFLAALMSADTGNHDKLARYTMHAREQKIDVLPPDVNESARDFTVVPGGIRFGLAGVKNVGEAAIEAIVEVRGDAPFRSLFDFALRIDSKRVNRRVVESLVKCGAFDSLHPSRAAVWAALDRALDAGVCAQRDRELGQGSLFDAGALPAATDPGLPDVAAWTDRERLGHEREVLGFYVTGHPLGTYAAQLQRYVDTTGGATEGKVGREVRVGGLVTALRELRTRKGGLMAFGTLEDLEGAFDLTVFPEPFARLGATLKTCIADAEAGRPTPIIVTGTLEGGDTPKLIVRDVIRLAEAEEKLASKLRLRFLAAEATPDRLTALRRVLKTHPGECSVTVHLTIPGESETVLALGDCGGVRPVPDLLRDVDALFGRPVAELSL
ncbi:MAG: DNA polymerase III subunit alpha [Deltaproteobacteria bacterium]|nr:DNA polymerase III subunit alpha [Deltaproteobacteria bacterium]